MAKSIIEQRKLAQGNMDDEGDFSVGTIAGMEDTDKEIIKGIRHLNKATKIENQPKGDVEDMATKAPKKEDVVISPESLEGTVELKLRKQYKDLVDAIIKNNDNVTVQEFDTHFQINARQIKVTRQDGERALGRLNDGQWRILFMNKKGELVTFDDYQFVLGVLPEEIEEAKETAQLNTRIDSKSKLEMDEIRELLGMTQAKFLEVAIAEYTQRVRAEML
jgi:hypothetical protein